MAAAALWRADRRANPRVLYAKVLGVIAGEDHDCSSCVLSDACSSEHVCCYAYVVDFCVRKGWAIRDNNGDVAMENVHAPGI